MKDFGKGIAEWAAETQEWTATRPAQMVRELFTSIAFESPYLTGRFIGNWHVGNTSPSFSTLATATAEQKVAEISVTINDEFFMFNNSAYMVNNLDYAKNVEELGWQRTHKYAPVAQSIRKKWMNNV